MNALAFLQNINGPEILIIFLIVLLLFGAKRLPELFRSFGKSIREFKKATSEIEDDIRTAMDEEPEKNSGTAKNKQVENRAADADSDATRPGAAANKDTAKDTA
jgi:sec-independent protein translocase protein TatA